MVDVYREGNMIRSASTVNLWQGVYDPVTNIPDLTQVTVRNNGWS
jgi:hypothetical protein